MNEIWDAGDISCGKLAFELHLRLSKMKPGERLEITSLDPGAPTDLPALCRMTGHALIFMDPPVYVIERKND